MVISSHSNENDHDEGYLIQSLSPYTVVPVFKRRNYFLNGENHCDICQFD